VAKLSRYSNKRYYSFSIHPYAHPAYCFFYRQSLLFNRDEMNEETVKGLAENHCIHCYQPNIESRELYIFSGFESVSFDLNKPIQPGSFIIRHQKEDIPNLSHIEELSWKGVLRALFNSISNKNLEEVRRNYNEFSSEKLNNALFKSPNLTQEFMSELCGISKYTLAKQAEKLNSLDCRISEEESFFDTLIRGDDND